MKRRMIRALYPTIDWDEYDREVVAEAVTPDPVGQLRAALSLARSMILTGEPMSPQAAAVFDEAFADAAKLLDIVEEYSRWAEVAERATAGGWTVHIGTRATCQEHIAAGDDTATEPLTAAAFGPAVRLLRELVECVNALENRALRSGGEFHVWAEERMLTEARDEARRYLAATEEGTDETT